MEGCVVVVAEMVVQSTEGPVHSKPFQVVKSDLHQEDREDKGNVAEEEDENSVDLQGLKIVFDFVFSLSSYCVVF